VSIPTRYPEDLQKLLKDYKKRNTAELIKGGREVLKWLRTQL
jgi:HEPN domain-containing protein